MTRLAAFAALFAALAAAPGAARERPASRPAEWVAVAPHALVAEVSRLAEHRRASGTTAEVAEIEEIERGHPATDRRTSIRAFLDDASRDGGARYVLLVGDAASLPPARDEGFFGKPFASDATYATAERAVGRFPSVDASVVRRLVDRTIAYEDDAKPAGWRRRVAFLGGAAGFAPALDSALEAAVGGILDREIPPELDLRVLRPDPASPYGVPEKEERQAILDLWGSGALIGLYAGHGSRDGLHTATQRGRTRRIFGLDDARRLEVRQGAPFLLFFACNVGEFDSAGGSCLASTLFEVERGPIAVLAASQTSHPYADLLLGLALTEVFRGSSSPRIGDLVRLAKGKVASGEGEQRERIDRSAETFGMSAEERTRATAYGCAVYNLLGDPAVHLLVPDAKTSVRAPQAAAAGDEIEVVVESDAEDGASVVATLERPRSAVPPGAHGPREANVRTLDQAAGSLEGKQWRGRLRIPLDAPRGRIVVVADVRGARSQGAAAAAVRIEDRASTRPADPNGSPAKPSRSESPAKPSQDGLPAKPPQDG
ncbi:MAG TPA: C25 family cysteine peptidase [Planctomycetota bacterium]|nr:C25 family cysteine peptidase [Planctomycetota bacterium]